MDKEHLDRSIKNLRANLLRGVAPRFGEHDIGQGVVIELHPVKKEQPSLGLHWRLKGNKRWKRV